MEDGNLTPGEIERSLHRIEHAVRGLQGEVRGMIAPLATESATVAQHGRRLDGLERWQARIMWGMASIGVTAAGALVTAAASVMLHR